MELGPWCLWDHSLTNTLIILPQLTSLLTRSSLLHCDDYFFVYIFISWKRSHNSHVSVINSMYCCVCRLWIRLFRYKYNTNKGDILTCLMLKHNISSGTVRHNKTETMLIFFYFYFLQILNVDQVGTMWKDKGEKMQKPGFVGVRHGDTSQQKFLNEWNKGKICIGTERTLLNNSLPREMNYKAS